MIWTAPLFSMMEMPSVAVRVAIAVSVTRTTNTESPARVGVPESEPSIASARPAGKAPDSSAHAYGGAPPLADSEAEYAAPITPVGKLTGEIASGTSCPRPEMRSLGRDVEGSRRARELQT